MKEINRKVVVLTKNGARVLGLLFWMGVAGCSGGTVKWSGAGDGSSWADLANWVDGGTVDFAKADPRPFGYGRQFSWLSRFCLP